MVRTTARPWRVVIKAEIGRTHSKAHSGTMPIRSLDPQKYPLHPHHNAEISPTSRTTAAAETKTHPLGPSPMVGRSEARRMLGINDRKASRTQG
jgi:hypothetical protein